MSFSFPLYILINMAARFEFEEKKEYDYRELGTNEEFHEFIIDIKQLKD